jgi:hypothetical protein
VSFVKKSDVKNHLSTHNRNGIHLHRPPSQPDATGFSEEQSASADSSPIESTVSQPSSSGVEAGQNKTQTDSGQVVTSAKSKSTRA